MAILCHAETISTGKLTVLGRDFIASVNSHGTSFFPNEDVDEVVGFSINFADPAHNVG